MQILRFMSRTPLLLLYCCSIFGGVKPFLKRLVSMNFEQYGILAENSELSFIQRSGRYKIQAHGVKRAILDIAEKLKINPEDRLLDVGCGVGDITIALSMMVTHTTCIDHPKVLAVFKKRLPEDNLDFIEGDFLEINISTKFDKILSYGVVMNLPSSSDVIRFIDKMVGLLVPGGRILVGDLPNINKKKRFNESRRGQEFAKEWNKLMSEPDNKRGVEWINRNVIMSEMNVVFDDQLIAELLLRYRTQGLDAYILPQPPDLAFGHTREDLLIICPD